MESRERLAVEIGLDAVNSSLTGLGVLPIGLNPDFQLYRVDPSGFLTYKLVKSQVALIWLDFAYDLMIGVELCPEFFVEPVGPEAHDRIAALCTRVFTSEILCKYGRRTSKVMIRNTGGEPWARITCHSNRRREIGETWYAPYVSV